MIDSERTREQWIAQLRSNDPDGLAAQADLHRFVRRGLGRAFGGDVDDATLDDMTQDALVRVITRLDTFRGDSRFTTWVMAIAVRVAYTALRRRRWGERSLEDLGLSPDAAGGPVKAAMPADRADLLASLREAIDRDLTARQRAAVLGELAGMPTAVLAGQLRTNVNALYKLHHDARVRLRSSLERRGFSRGEVSGMLAGASER